MTVRYAGCNAFHPAYRTVIYIEWKYQVSRRYGIFSWWWAHGCPKHAEESNKHIKKICAPSWFYLQDCTWMHGQQNIKFWLLYLCCKWLSENGTSVPKHVGIDIDHKWCIIECLFWLIYCLSVASLRQGELGCRPGLRGSKNLADWQTRHENFVSRSSS